VTAREIPDTIVANVSVEHRLRMVVHGAPLAAIRSDPVENIADGVFLTAGSRVSLRAEPEPSAVFAGWSGDTISTHDTLTVILRHPFDLTADFVAFREVALSSAAGGILGTASLPGEDLLYLDAAGNRNGSYDLGDFVAAVDREPGAAQSHVMAQRER
jgi:hypothetical protein